MSAPVAIAFMVVGVVMCCVGIAAGVIGMVALLLLRSRRHMRVVQRVNLPAPPAVVVEVELEGDDAALFGDHDTTLSHVARYVDHDGPLVLRPPAPVVTIRPKPRIIPRTVAEAVRDAGEEEPEIPVGDGDP